MGLVESHFWYEPAYRALFDALPPEQRSVWVEVGVFEGAAVKWLAEQVIVTNKNVVINAVDTFQGWPGVTQGAELRASFTRNTRTVAGILNHYGIPQFRLHARPSLEVAANFPLDSCDVVWLDADHSYEAVKADIAAWWPKVKSGGALGGDDWAWKDGGVQRAVEEAFPTDPVHLINGEREGEVWPSWIVRKPVTPTDS